jgi:hypothetical protein
MKRKLFSMVLGVGLLAAPFAIGVESAGAATAPSGYMCGYDGQTYAGSNYCLANDTVHWTAFANKASSAAANGANCEYSRYWSGWNIITGEPEHDYFTLYSEQMTHRNYRDPNLSNGAGFDGAGTNFNNTIEASQFLMCQ